MLKALLAVFASVAITSAAAAQAQRVTAEMMVKSPDAGIEIFVRNKRPASMKWYRSDRTVLFVHGATYPAHAAFDLRLGGQSWMEYIASRGYDVYLLDVRGYGKSTRPKEMAEDAKINPPIVRGDTAVKDIGTVVDFILSRAATSRASTCSASRRARRSWRLTPRRIRARSSGWRFMRRLGSGRRRRWCKLVPGRSPPTGRC